METFTTKSLWKGRTMSPRKQQIAIATACGWTDCHFPLASNVSLPFTERVLCGIPPHSTIHKPLPDYLGDLNACHEMEKVLMEKGVNAWWSYVAFINRHNPRPFGTETAVHATAAQRCEAFLRTLGLWEKEAQ